MEAKTGTKLLIHHISDIHIGKFHYKAGNQIPGIVSEPKGPLNLNLYEEYLRNCQIDDLPDLVIISGDLTSYASEDEMRMAKNRIKTIKDVLKKKDPSWRRNRASSVDAPPYILMVPGNHDLNWNKELYEEKVDRYAQMAESLYHDGVLSAIYPSKDYRVSYDFGDECNLFVYLLNSTFLGGVKDSKLNEIYKSLSSLYDRIELGSGEDIQSALKSLQDEIRKDPGYVSPDDLAQMNNELKKIKKSRIKVAVMHHNLSSVPSRDLEGFDTIINAGVVKKSLMNNGFDIILHGHRHFIHCSHERYLAPPEKKVQGIYILGGGTLGMDPSAPFLEVQLCGTDKAHVKDLPVCLFTASLTECGDAVCNRRSVPIIEEEIIDSPMNSAVVAVLKKLGRTDLQSDKEDRQHLQQSLDMIQPPIQALQSKLRDWGEGSDTWVKEFNFQLGNYSRIYATDYYTRSSIENPRFNKYLHEQFAARLERLKSKSNNCLRFSKPIYNAIIRTNWQPDPTMWNNYKIEKIENSSQENLEIVRILIRPKATLQERQVMENLDFEHRIFAIPLFVLDSEQLNPNEIGDFAIGFNETGKAIKSYEFSEVEGKVKEVNPYGRGLMLQEVFERMLSNGSLKTVKDFNRHGLMITDRTDARIFAANYDKTRKPSKAILEKMIQNLHPSPSKAYNGIEFKTIGLDIGCGTGNYTIPFINYFNQVIGIDVSKEMLDKAREKSDKVKWIERDALDTRLPDEYCDAVWLISSLHYFIGDGQKLLFKEIFRILKKGGIVFMDTEFKEQHDSLWLVEFFPSLRDRYKNTIFSTEKYKTWLDESGFSNIRFESIIVGPDENDASLRIGQHDPRRYLEPGITEGIPAFKEMDPYAFSEGLRKLRDAIEDGTIDKIIKRYEDKATMEGDDGFIIATRPT